MTCTSLSLLITCTYEIYVHWRSWKHGSTNFFVESFCLSSNCQFIVCILFLVLYDPYMTHNVTCFNGFCASILCNCKPEWYIPCWYNTFDFVALQFTCAIVQVLIRYGKYSNSTLMLDFGFALTYNIHDQVCMAI